MEAASIALVSVAAPSLADTGSDILPWIVGGGIVVLIGVAALIIGAVVRRRSDRDDDVNAPVPGETGGSDSTSALDDSGDEHSAGWDPGGPGDGGSAGGDSGSGSPSN